MIAPEILPLTQALKQAGQHNSKRGMHGGCRCETRASASMGDAALGDGQFVNRELCSLVDDDGGAGGKRTSMDIAMELRRTWREPGSARYRSCAYRSRPVIELGDRRTLSARLRVLSAIDKRTLRECAS